MLYYLFYLPLHPQPVYTSPFQTVLMIRWVLRQKHQIPDGTKRNALTSSGCDTGPLGLGLALPHTYIILPFFLSPLHIY